MYIANMPKKFAYTPLLSSNQASAGSTEFPGKMP